MCPLPVPSRPPCAELPSLGVPSNGALGAMEGTAPRMASRASPRPLLPWTALRPGKKARGRRAAGAMGLLIVACAES